MIRNILLIHLLTTRLPPSAFTYTPPRTSRRNLPLNLMTQIPEFPIVRAVDVVGEFVAEGGADGVVGAVAVVGVGAETQFDDLAGVAVEAEEAGGAFVGGGGVG